MEEDLYSIMGRKGKDSLAEVLLFGVPLFSVLVKGPREYSFEKRGGHRGRLSRDWEGKTDYW